MVSTRRQIAAHLVMVAPLLPTYWYPYSHCHWYQWSASFQYTNLIARDARPAESWPAMPHPAPNSTPLFPLILSSDRIPSLWFLSSHLASTRELSQTVVPTCIVVLSWTMLSCTPDTQRSTVASVENHMMPQESNWFEGSQWDTKRMSRFARRYYQPVSKLFTQYTNNTGERRARYLVSGTVEAYFMKYDSSGSLSINVKYHTKCWNSAAR